MTKTSPIKETETLTTQELKWFVKEEQDKTPGIQNWFTEEEAYLNYLEQLRQAYQSPKTANTINYVIDYLQVSQIEDVLERNLKVESIENNLLTAICEVRELQANRQTSYYQQIDYEKGRLLSLQNDDILQICFNGIHSEQLNYHDQLRAQKDYEIAHNYLQGRLQGNPQTFVKFSKNPVDINPTAYKGTDYEEAGFCKIFFHNITEDGAESVTEYAVDALRYNEYQELFNNLQALDNIPYGAETVIQNNIQDTDSANDLAVFDASGFYTQEQTDYIFNFVQSKITGVDRSKMEHVINYKKVVLRQIQLEILPLLHQIGEGLEKADKTELALKFLRQQMDRINLEYTLFIQELNKDLQLLNIDIQQSLFEQGISGFASFTNLTTTQRTDATNNAGYTGSGCNISKNIGTSTIGDTITKVLGSALSGKKSKRMSREKKEKLIYECERCDYENDINVDLGIYCEQCECCGYEPPRCG